HRGGTSGGFASEDPANNFITGAVPTEQPGGVFGACYGPEQERRASGTTARLMPSPSGRPPILSAAETDLESLLPDRWAASHPEQVLQHRLDESQRNATRRKEARQTRRAIAGPNA